MKYVILSLLVLFPVRRISDLRLLKLVDNEEDLNDKFNYYIPKTKTLIFLNYKTKRLYKRQDFKINDELANIINKYISSYNIQNDDFIFNRDGVEYKQADMTSFIIRYTKKVYGVSISPSLFRTIYCSMFYSTGRTNKEADLCSQRLAHSVEEARMTYSKI